MIETERARRELPGYRRWLISAAVLWPCALLLGWAAHEAGPLPGDLGVSRFLQNVLPFNDIVAALWRGLSATLRVLPYALTLGLLLWRKWDWAALVPLANLPIMVISEAGIKAWFDRPRPTTDLVNVYMASRGLSFPSGTALQTLADVGVILYLLWLRRDDGRMSAGARLIAALSLGFLLLSNLARVHVGAHWATDIWGGWLFSAAWLSLILAAHQWWLNRRASKP